MKVETTRFGTLELEEGDQIEFRKGLFGYDDVKRYVLLDHRPDSPLRWLQAVESAGLAFVVIDPCIFCPSYRFELSPDEGAVLGHTEGDVLMPLVIVGIPESPEEMTANLKGPLVVNTATRLGIQIIQGGDEYSPRVRILDAIRDLHGATNR